MKRQDRILNEIIKLSTNPVKTGVLMIEYTKILYDKVLKVLR